MPSTQHTLFGAQTPYLQPLFAEQGKPAAAWGVCEGVDVGDGVCSCEGVEDPVFVIDCDVLAA